MPSHFSKWLSSFTESITSPLLSSINNKLYKRQLKASLSHFIDLGNVKPVWIDGGIKVQDASLNAQHITNALSDFSLRLSYSKLTSLHVLVKKQNFKPVMQITMASLQTEFHLYKELTQPNESLVNSALPALRDILERLMDTIGLELRDVKIYLVDARNVAILVHFKGLQYRHTPSVDGNSNISRRTLSCDSITFHTADLRNGIDARTAEYEPIISLGTESLSVDFGQCHRHRKSSNTKKLHERRNALLEISGTCNIHGCIRPGQIRGLLTFADHWSNITQKSAEQISLWTELGNFRIDLTCHKVVVLLIPDSSRQDVSNISILDQFHTKPFIKKNALPLTCSYTQIHIEDLLATLHSTETSNPNSLSTTIKATDISVFYWKQNGTDYIPIPIIILDPDLCRAYTSSHTNPKILTLAQRRRSNFPDTAVTDWTYAECRKRGVDLLTLRTKARKTPASFNGFSISINFQEEGGEYFPMKVDVLLPPVQVYFDLRYLLHNNEARMFLEYMLERRGQRKERNVKRKKPSIQIQTDMLRLHIRCFPETIEDKLTSGTLIFDIRNLHITRPHNHHNSTPDSTSITLLDLKFNLILASCTSLSSPCHASSFISSGKSKASDPTPCITLIDTNSPELSLAVNIPSTDILISETQLEDFALIMNDMKRVLGHSFHPVVSVVDDDVGDVPSSSGVRSEENGSGQAVSMSAELPVGSEQTANAANLVVQDASMKFKLPLNKFWGMFK